MSLESLIMCSFIFNITISERQTCQPNESTKYRVYKMKNEKNRPEPVFKLSDVL